MAVTDVTGELAASSLRVVKEECCLDQKAFDSAHASRNSFASELYNT
jgi:hypothetical protein